MKPKYTYFLIVLLICAAGAVGESDYKQSKSAEKHYCAMVESGKWPHYDGSINCGE